MPIFPIIDPKPRRGDLMVDAFLVPFALDAPKYPLYLKPLSGKQFERMALTDARHVCAACTVKILT
jgi:hypothetical protein